MRLTWGPNPSISWLSVLISGLDSEVQPGPLHWAEHWNLQERQAHLRQADR